MEKQNNFKYTTNTKLSGFITSCLYLNAGQKEKKHSNHKTTTSTKQRESKLIEPPPLLGSLSYNKVSDDGFNSVPRRD